MIDASNDTLGNIYDLGHDHGYAFRDDEAGARLQHWAGLRAVAAEAWQMGRASAVNPFEREGAPHAEA